MENLSWLFSQQFPWYASLSFFPNIWDASLRKDTVLPPKMTLNRTRIPVFSPIKPRVVGQWSESWSTIRWCREWLCRGSRLWSRLRGLLSASLQQGDREARSASLLHWERLVERSQERREFESLSWQHYHVSRGEHGWCWRTFLDEAVSSVVRNAFLKKF